MTETMTNVNDRCRYDREKGAYLLGDQPCKVDGYGDPTVHCTATRSCSNHVGRGELTCPRCLGRARTNLRQIVTLVAMMLPEAIELGSVDSEAASLAGPAADPAVLSWRRINAARIAPTWAHIGDGSDEDDPTGLLGAWQAALSEDYGHDLPDRITLGTASAYLERNLQLIAQDPEQDFPLLSRELRACRNRLEGVLRDSRKAERGAPCPECTNDRSGVGPRLQREYGHWCEDEDCTKLHYADDSADRWVCPRNRDHAWDVESYSRWIEERHAYTRLARAAGE